MKKHLKDITLDITEAEYRQDGCVHYSTLSSFERGGFHSIPTLGEKKESPSLTFGSVVDTLMTDGMDAFREQYIIGRENTSVSDKVGELIKILYGMYGQIYPTIASIPANSILEVLDENKYCMTYGKAKRLEKIYAGSSYYDDLMIASGKTVISQEDYDDAMNCVRVLKTSPGTAMLFQDDDSEDIERCYQLKFRQTLDGIEFSCMAD